VKPVVFPSIGWREARHKKAHGNFSKPWKKMRGFFQALENGTARKFFRRFGE
jgi:hypothetical protein